MTCNNGESDNSTLKVSKEMVLFSGSTRNAFAIAEIILSGIHTASYGVDLEGDVTLISLLQEIEKLDEQSKIIILYHPNSNTIMEMVVNGKELLDFDTTMTKMVNERNGFIFIGCVIYLFVFLSVIELIKIRKKK